MLKKALVLAFLVFGASLLWGAPTVSFTYPASGGKVGGIVNVTVGTANAVKVMFYKGTTLVGTDTTAPFAMNYNFNADAPGSNYTLKAVAYDSLNVTATATRTVAKPNANNNLSSVALGTTLDSGGCFFKVWAKYAQQVYVVGTFNGNSTTANKLNKTADGYFYGYVNKAVAENQYKYYIQGPSWNAAWQYRADPYSRMMVNSVGDSIIKNPAAFAWTDGAFTTPKFEDMIIYKLHVGTFTRRVGTGDAYRKLNATAGKLDYLKGLGINTIELIPVNECPLDYTLGYSQNSSFAIESSYGSAQGKAYDELKAFVNLAHSKGIAVIEDVCFNHYGTCDTEGGYDLKNTLWGFDGDYGTNNGGGSYFHGWYTPKWGPAPDYAKPEVKKYIDDSCRYFLSELHMDGLRWDHTSTVSDMGGKEQMRDIIWGLKTTWPSKIFTAEQNDNDTSIVTYCNFSSMWHVDFHHGIEKILGGDQNHGADVYQAISGSQTAQVFSRVVYSIGHDETWNGQYNAQTFGGRNSWDSRAKCRVIGALQFFVPGIPMLFQGEEFIQDGKAGDYDINQSPNWAYQTDGVGSQMQKMYQDAINVRKAYTSLRYGYLEYAHNIGADGVIAFTRRDPVSLQVSLVVANFSPTTWTGHGFKLGAGKYWGTWTQTFCSQDAAYGGWDGAGNAYYNPSTQSDGSIWINVPKYSVMVFKLN